MRAKNGRNLVAFVGFLTTLLGLVAMLAENVIEFWVAADPGGFLTLVGLLVQPIGPILLGFPVFKANVLPRWGRPVPLGFGAILGLMLVVVMVRLAAGIRVQEKLFAAVIMTIGLGWMVLGYALWSGWSAKGDTESRRGLTEIAGADAFEPCDLPEARRWVNIWEDAVQLHR